MSQTQFVLGVPPPTWNDGEEFRIHCGISGIIQVFKFIFGMLINSELFESYISFLIRNISFFLFQMA